MNRLVTLLFVCTALLFSVLDCSAQETFLDSIPSGITPNGDGHNDTWIIRKPNQTATISLHIFDRWGKLIRHYSNYNNDWGGTDANGTALKNGTYYYQIKVVNNVDGEDLTGTGWINIMREIKR